MKFDPAKTKQLLNSSNLSSTNPSLYQALSNIIDGLSQIATSKVLDSGIDYVVGADIVSGTKVNFNYKFGPDVKVVANSLNDTAIRFVNLDEINNTFFRARLYNYQGTQREGYISWIAYGTPIL